MSTTWPTSTVSFVPHTFSNRSCIMSMVSSQTNLLFLYKTCLLTYILYRDMNAMKYTSENAGAVIFLKRFHSSNSDATMLRPKKVRALYILTGFGKRSLYDVISYRHSSLVMVIGRKVRHRSTLIATGSATANAMDSLGSIVTFHRIVPS